MELSDARGGHCSECPPLRLTFALLLDRGALCASPLRAALALSPASPASAALGSHRAALGSHRAALGSHRAAPTTARSSRRNRELFLLTSISEPGDGARRDRGSYGSEFLPECLTFVLPLGAWCAANRITRST